MDLSWHNTDQVWLLSRLTYFYMRYCPLQQFSFPDFSFVIFQHIELKFYIWICFDIILSLLYHSMYSFWSYASLKFVGAGRGHVLLQQYLQYACLFNVLFSSSINILLKKILHHLYYVYIFPNILQTARKITYDYWYIYLVMTADRNSDKTYIILLFLLLQSRDWVNWGYWTPFAKVTTFRI